MFYFRPVWRFCISDKEITSKSGFINKLQRGDEVMADRGFNIQEMLASKGVPPFMTVF